MQGLTLISFSPPQEVEGSAEVTTQTALDLLLNMSGQRELPANALEVRLGVPSSCGVVGRMGGVVKP